MGLTIKHLPTDISRAEVTALTSFGNTQEEVALYLEISVDTLTRHYRRELDTAVVKANAMVARGLFNKATKQDDLSAQIFWLKTRGRWRTADNEFAGIDYRNQKDELESLKERVDDLNKKNKSDI